MTKFISFKLALIFLISALAPAFVAIAAPPSCENGECIEHIVNQLNDLNQVYAQKCLPEEGAKELVSLSEECFILINEINQLETELAGHTARLEEKMSCSNGDCQNLDSDTVLTKVEEGLSCTEPKKKEVRKACPNDLHCAYVSSSLLIGGYIAEAILPDKAKLKDCHMGDDSCMVQLATGFWKATVSFFEGMGDLVQMGANSLWKWMTKAEDHSSTSQLALAKASEDTGFFDLLMKDFSGTMYKVWEGLVAALKEWMKTDILCQKWKGLPHSSECLQPTDNIDCVSCKSLLNGFCAVWGIIAAEVIPSFFTAGLATAAKYGANGAVKIAKTFKVSKAALSTIKNSRFAKSALKASTKVDDVLKLTKVSKAARIAISTSLKVAQKYLLSPLRKKIKYALSVMVKTMKSGTAYIAKSKAGNILVFNLKAAKLAKKVILYPVYNPMTAFAYKTGGKTFAKILKVGPPKLYPITPITSVLIKHHRDIENILIKIEQDSSGGQDYLASLQAEMLSKIGTHRPELVRQALMQENPEIEEIINLFYPELEYGPLAQKLSPERILAAEQELLLEIQKMPQGPGQETILRKYQEYTAPGEARDRVIKVK